MVFLKKKLGFLMSGLITFTLIVTSTGLSKAETSQGDYFGFSKERVNWQREFEEMLSERVDPENIGYYSRNLSSFIAEVGTKGNKDAVDFSVNELRKAGLNPEVDSYDVYLPRPNELSVTQTAPEVRELKVMEDLPPEIKAKVIPGFAAYSPSGTVEGELVYANYGRPEDFEELKRRGISVKDKIVITRYGQNFRGVKTDQAAKHGAKGVLIYSDPADDGYARGEVYPKGPWRPADSIQRGSIVALSKYPGDPLTPGEPSKPGVERLDPADAESLPTIPTQPISYGEARHLLEAMDGDQVPEAWQGALPFEYHFGAGAAKVRLSLDIDYDQRPVNNVIVRIPGAKYPDEMVVLGAHRDTWAFGANDNTSGWATTMEIARVLGEMYQEGWKPDRTIVLAGWDGEEYGLLGSTEWVEDKKKELTENAVAYLNMDSVGGQFVNSAAVPSMKELIYSVMKTVTEPRTGTSVFDDWYERSGNRMPNIGQLGSGSDYTAFIDHIGVPSGGVGFSSPGGAYHSAYDNTDFLERFGDPGYLHHGATVEIVGKMALRLANADVIPLRYSTYAEEVSALLVKKGEEYKEDVDLSGVIAQAEKWKEEAAFLEAKNERVLSVGNLGKAESESLSAVNRAMIEQERTFINEEGLPSRPWYKHVIWAPGLTTGYAALPLPELSEALESGDAKAIDAAVQNLEKALGEAARTAASAQTINASSIIKHVDYFAENGDIKNKGTARALTAHLTAISRFESKESSEKVVKHTEGFKKLLNQFEKNDLVTEEARNALMKEADSLLKKWE
ncbi:aminopeptidase [Bacillus freudenreichii]|nr:aminopeptidase [Bacillus freudenreichii]